MWASGHECVCVCVFCPTSWRVWRHQNLTSVYAVVEKRSQQSRQASGFFFTSATNALARSCDPTAVAHKDGSSYICAF